MTLSHNPATFLNGFISMSRNVFLTSSVALAALGYSQKSKLFNEMALKVVALIVILFSITYGLKASYDFHKYLTFMENDKDQLKPPYTFQIKQWKGWVYLTVIYTILLTIGLFFGFIQIFRT